MHSRVKLINKKSYQQKTNYEIIIYISKNTKNSGNGIRTRVSRMRVCDPEPLDDAAMLFYDIRNCIKRQNKIKYKIFRTNFLLYNFWGKFFEKEK